MTATYNYSGYSVR